jgi:hypothetical protein
MPYYTDEDVHVAWSPGGKHFKKRQNLNFIDYNEPNKFFIDALNDHKDIICLVGSVQKLNHYSAPRYQLGIRVGVRRRACIPDSSRHIINYWGLWQYDAHMEAISPAVNYATAPFVSTAVLPCTKRKMENELVDVDRSLIAPRVMLAPPFGKEYVVNLDASLKTKDLANWAGYINIAVQKVHKQFVDPDDELV